MVHSKNIVQKDFAINDGHLNYNERRVLDEVRQLLNGGPNIYQDLASIGDIYRFYRRSLKDSINVTFKKSLVQSGRVLTDKDKVISEVKKLKKDDSNSFIILPPLIDSHVISTIIRKINNEYTATIANKGARNNENQIIQYTLTEENLMMLLKAFKQRNYNISHDEVYSIFEENSNKISNLGYFSGEQKFANCFIKEPEFALKFAFATRNFKSSDFENFPLTNAIFHPKWDNSTLETHKKYINEVKKSYPQINEELDSCFRAYEQNKEFRDRVDPRQCFSYDINYKMPLEDVFTVKNHEITSQPKEEQILSKLNYETVLKYLDEIKDALKNENVLIDPSVYIDMVELFSKMLTRKEVIYFMEKEDFDGHLALFKILKDKLPECAKHISLEMHSTLTNGGNFFYNQGYFEEAVDFYSRALQFYPSNEKVYESRAGAYGQIGDLNSALKDVEKSLELRPDKESTLEFKKAILGASEHEKKIKTADRIAEIIL